MSVVVRSHRRQARLAALRSELLAHLDEIAHEVAPAVPTWDAVAHRFVMWEFPHNDEPVVAADRPASGGGAPLVGAATRPVSAERAAARTGDVGGRPGVGDRSRSGGVAAQAVRNDPVAVHSNPVTVRVEAVDVLGRRNCVSTKRPRARPIPVPV